MDLHFKSFIIFLSIIFIIALAAAFPSGAMLGFAIALGSGIIIYQTIVILKDKG